MEHGTRAADDDSRSSGADGDSRSGGTRVNESWGYDVPTAEMKPGGVVRWAAGGILQKR
jgi:hypothetical protein